MRHPVFLITPSHLHVFLIEALFVLKVVVFRLQEILEHEDVVVAFATAGVARVVNLRHRQPEKPFTLQVRICVHYD